MTSSTVVPDPNNINESDFECEHPDDNIGNRLDLNTGLSPDVQDNIGNQLPPASPLVDKQMPNLHHSGVQGRLAQDVLGEMVGVIKKAWGSGWPVTPMILKDSFGLASEKEGAVALELLTLEKVLRVEEVTRFDEITRLDEKRQIYFVK